MSYKTYKLFIGALVLISSIAPSSAQVASLPKLLEQARAAIASDSRLKEIKSFSAVFTIRQALLRGGELKSEVRLDFILSDKLLKNETVDLPGNAGQVTSSFLLNGERAWSDVRASNSKIPILRDDSENERADLFQRLRKENAFYLIQLLLTAPSYSPVEFIYAGEAQAEDGRADVLDVKGLNNFAARLYFDKESHRLLMMSYREPLSQGMLLSRGKSDKRALQPDSRGETPKEPSIEVQLHFSDYRAEDGIVVPHLITQDRNGKPLEEKRLKSFKVNPAFKPDHFEVKRKS